MNNRKIGERFSIGQRIKDESIEGLTFEIVKHIGVLKYGSNETGGTKEVNLVSWNGNKPVYDIRTWWHDTETGAPRFTRGITMDKAEFRRLLECCMDDIF